MSKLSAWHVVCAQQDVVSALPLRGNGGEGKICAGGREVSASDAHLKGPPFLSLFSYLLHQHQTGHWVPKNRGSALGSANPWSQNFSVFLHTMRL